MKTTDFLDAARLAAVSFAGGALLVGCLAIGACSLNSANGTPTPTVTETLGTACDSYGAALAQLAAARALHELTANQVAAVNAVNLVTDPLCKGPLPPANLSSAIAAVGEATAQIVAIKGGNAQ